MSEEDQKLLASLSDRFSITQSEVIRRALKVFAAKTKHNITLCYREPIKTKTDGTTEINIASDNLPQLTDEEFEQLEWDQMIERLSK